MQDLIEKIREVANESELNILKRHNGNEYYAYNIEKGCNVLLMAHVDIVKRKEKKFKRINKFIYEMTGADDRLGIAIIEHLLDYGFKFSYLLTNYEESGSYGAHEFVKNEILDKDINLIVALDRRGSSHYVTYSEVNNKTKLDNYLRKIGLFEEGSGSYSDCQVISNAFDVAHINIATGYHLEHTNEEYFNVNETEYCLYVVKSILENQPKEKHKIKRFNYNKYKRKIDYLYNIEKECTLLRSCVEMVEDEDKELLEKSEYVEHFKEVYCKNCSFKIY